MYSYKLTIAYDGTQYSGWQIQPNAVSIQQILQDALKTILRIEDVSLIASGRTDAGVHAKGQVAHFRHPTLIEEARLQVSLNGIVPRDIRIKKVEVVSSHFHAQYHAIGKEYHYHLYLERVMDPFQRLYCWHVHTPLDFDRLKKASCLFVGTHDFTSFANEAYAGSASRNPVRTLYRLEVIPTEGGARLEFEGNGFLYKMVRNIVGMLVEVASGKREIESIPAVLEAKDRRLAARAAPPQGLFLMRVDYPSLI
jgi:tRNA pseudouridine38-40 synthase